MRVLILAAGYGTRLKELADDTPKSLLEVSGKPLVNHILDRIKHLNALNEVILVTNNKFAGHFEKWAVQTPFAHPIRVVNDRTNSPEDRLGSIGDIDYVLQKESTQDDLLVVGGDNLFDFNVNQYIISAQAQTDAVTIGLYDIGSLEEAKLFGVAEMDEQNRVISFEEKPSQPKSTLIAMCFYYFPKATLGYISDYLKEVCTADRAGDYIRWLQENFVVFGFKFSGKWYDIGSIESYHEAQENFRS